MIDNRGTTPKVVFGLTNTRPNGDDAVDLWYVNKVLT
jgi:hypothetical protein